MDAINSTIGDSPSKAEVIIDFLNWIPKEQVVEANINTYEWVARANQMKMKHELVTLVEEKI